MQLNAKQQEAIRHRSGPLLVLAGAGSGKTTVLTERIVELVREGVPETAILAITFTNKAAKELKQRIHGRLGRPTTGLSVSTFHAACARILQTEHKRAGKEIALRILEPATSLRLLERLCQTSTHPLPFSVEEAARYISFFKNELVDAASLLRKRPNHSYMDWAKIQDFLEAEVPEVEQLPLFDLYARYERVLVEQGALDFDDLLMQSVQLFIDSPEILWMYQQKFQYVMIDEYQDTNRAQYIFAYLLTMEHRNLAVVGDDFQSIYSFRGSDIRNILNFDVDYPEATVIKLEENYRCPPTILQAANEVIARNEHQTPKHLYTQKQQGEKVGYFQAATDQEEARFLSKQIHHLLEEGYRHEDISILYRTHAISAIVRETFIKQGLPFFAPEEQGVFEHPELKRMLAWLAFIDDPEKIHHFNAIVNYPVRRISEESLFVLTEDRKGLFLRLRNPPSSLPYKERLALEEFVQLVDELHIQQAQLPLRAWVQEVLDRTGFTDSHRRLKDGIALEYQELATALVGLAERVEHHETAPTCQSFLRHLSKCFYEEQRTNEQAVRFLSIHAAKGLEFPIVFLIGIEEGVFPHKKSSSKQALEEERRMFYVGLTRAQEKLYVSHAEKRQMWNRMVAQEPSRFLFEFHPSLYEPSFERSHQQLLG